MGRRIVLSLLFLTASVACVQTNAVVLNPSAAALRPIPPDSVRIFISEAELDTLVFTRVAIIEATGSGEFTSQSKMIESMREKASKLGANGLLLPTIAEPGAAAKVAGAIFNTGTERKGSVVAIHITGRKTP